MLIKRSLKGASMGFFCFIVLTLIGGLLLKITPIPEIWGFGIIIAALSVTCFFTSFYISAGITKAGMITGMITSILLIFIIFIIISLIISGGVEMANLLNIYYLIPIVIGIIGGIGGINLKK